MNNYASQSQRISEGNEEDLSASKLECDRLKKRVKHLEKQLISVEAQAVAEMLDSGIEDSNAPAAKIVLLEHQLDTAFEDVKEKGRLLKQTEEALHHMERLLAAKTTEYDALQVILHRRREEAEKQEVEVNFLDERIRVLEKTLLDEGLVVPDRPESMIGRRKPNQSGAEALTVCRSRDTQTALTFVEIAAAESERDGLKRDFGSLNTNFETAKVKWASEFEEMVQNLQVKTGLVKTLTDRIQTMNEEFEEGRDQMNEEREGYKKRLEEISKVAGRVPILERELQSARDETQLAEHEKVTERQGYEEAIESSLVDGMKNQLHAGQYWREKMTWAQEQIEDFRRQAEKAKKELADTKMRLSLEKVALEQKLEGSYSEMSHMSDRIYVPKEHREIMAKPDLRDKMVTCHPATEQRGTELHKGDLYDETEENLKLVLGELSTTRRQVEVLQEKLVAHEKDASDGFTEKTEWVHADVQALKRELATLKAERAGRESLGDTLFPFDDTAPGESRSTKQVETEKIERLETEFDALRREMDSVIKRYETEKSRHLSRIKTLEKSQRERDVLRAKLKKVSGVEELEQQDFEEFVSLETLESQIELLDKAEDFYSADEEPCVAVAVAPAGEELLRDHSQITTPSPQLLGIEPRKKRNSAANEFLLKRLQKEREGFVARNEELTEKNRELELENAELREEVEAEKRKLKQELEAKICPSSLQKCVSEPKIIGTTVFPKTAQILSDCSTAEHSAAGGGAANLRAKNLVLIKENRRLFGDLARLRATLVQLLQKSASSSGSAELSAEGQEIVVADDEKPSNVQATVEMEQPEIKEMSVDGSVVEERVIRSKVKLELPKRSPLKSNGDLAGDLEAVRHDLEGILEQIDEATSHERAEEWGEPSSDDTREGRLMKWLEKELKKEKEELEVLSMWYEQDKRRLESDISHLKGQRCELRARLDRQELELHDVARELDFYRSEDSARITGGRGLAGLGSGGEDGGGGGMRRWDSDSNVGMPRESLEKMAVKWKYKAGEMLKDLTKWEREYLEANEERIELREEVVMLNGEIEILKAQREADRENQKYKLEMAQVSAQAQQTKADMEAAVLKDIVIPNLYENEFRSGFKDRPGAEGNTGEIPAVKRVTGTLAMAPLTGGARDESGSSGSGGKEKDAGVLRKQLEESRNAEKEAIDRIVRFGPELAAKNAEIARLKESVEKSEKSLVSAKEDGKELRRRVEYLEEENRLLLAEAEMDAETSKLVDCLREQMEELRKGVAEEKLKERAEYTEKLEQLERELAQKRDMDIQFREIQDILTLPASDCEGEKSGKTTEDTTSYKTAPQTPGMSGDPNFDRIFEEEEIRSLREELSKNEERAVRAEQELEMVSMELKMCREGYTRELETLKMEKTELQERLHHAIIMDDKAESIGTPGGSMASLETVRQLQEQVDRLRIEMDEKERQHQEMYLTMFKKGQETAKRELAADLGENISIGSGDFHEKMHKEFLSKGYVSGQGDLTDDEVVLRFLRDAVYYFLIGKDGKDHLTAIMSILKFSEKQRGEVHKIRGSLK